MYVQLMVQFLIIQMATGTRCRIGIVATSYKNDRVERVIYISERKFAEPAKSAFEHFNNLLNDHDMTNILLRSVMLFEERNIVLKRGETWKFVHGPLIPFELRTGRFKKFPDALEVYLELAKKIIESKNIIGVKGDLFIGKLVGYEEVDIYMDASNKKVLPRNIGIFGTVGSGKTNTAQVIIEEASKAGYSVIIVDVEGEYVGMDKPTKELLEKLKKYGRKPRGLTNFSLFYPCNGDVPRVDGKERKDAKRFDIKFSNVDPYVIFELINASEAQERGLSELIDKLGEKPTKSKKKSKAIQFIEGTSFEQYDYTIEDAIKNLFALIQDKKINSSTGYALTAKLKQLRRMGIFDKGVGEIDIDSILKPGKVSVIDVSSSSDYVKNAVIAWLLRKVFLKKLEDPKNTPKTLLLIEEAHTFISKESKDKMTATLDMLKIIARRGRKRWLCLGFISQQPSHLPPEIFELCNTRFVHSIKSQNNINAIKYTTGEVIEEIWNSVPALGVGEALIISPQFKHPMIIDVRPCETKREYID